MKSLRTFTIISTEPETGSGAFGVGARVPADRSPNARDTLRQRFEVEAGGATR